MKIRHAFAALLAAALLSSATAAPAVAAPPVASVTCADVRANPATAHAPCLDAGTTGPGLPGGEKPPQFVMFTHDDALTTEVFDLVGAIRRCGAPMTFYAFENRTDCAYARAFHENGDEIALHTRSHSHLTSVQADRLRDEAVGSVRTFLNETCGIPLEDLVGFRAPFLETDAAVRRALYADGKIRYDSTYSDLYPSEWSLDAANRLWPYTQHDPNGPFKNSTAGDVESYPGMWSLPLLNMQGAGQSSSFTMDPPKFATEDGSSFVYGTAPAMLALLKKNFDEVYAGSRAPIGVYVHVGWLAQPGFTDAVSEFVAYVNNHSDARFATASQLVDWLENPVPASAMPPRDLTCRVAVVVETPESFWERTWMYWLIPIITIGPVFAALAVSGIMALVRRTGNQTIPDVSSNV